MPPMSWTSKCRIDRTRRPASRQTANASGSRSSSDAPWSSRFRNSPVIARRSASDFAFSPSSSELMCSTIGRIPLMTRAFLVPKIFFATKLIIVLTPSDDGAGRHYCAVRRHARQRGHGLTTVNPHCPLLTFGRSVRVGGWGDGQLDDAGDEPGERDD